MQIQSPNSKQPVNNVVFQLLIVSECQIECILGFYFSVHIVLLNCCSIMPMQHRADYANSKYAKLQSGYDDCDEQQGQKKTSKGRKSKRKKKTGAKQSQENEEDYVSIYPVDPEDCLDEDKMVECTKISRKEHDAQMKQYFKELDAAIEEENHKGPTKAVPKESPHSTTISQPKQAPQHKQVSQPQHKQVFQPQPKQVSQPQPKQVSQPQPKQVPQPQANAWKKTQTTIVTQTIPSTSTQTRQSKTSKAPVMKFDESPKAKQQVSEKSQQQKRDNAKGNYQSRRSMQKSRNYQGGYSKVNLQASLMRRGINPLTNDWNTDFAAQQQQDRESNQSSRKQANAYLRIQIQFYIKTQIHLNNDMKSNLLKVINSNRGRLVKLNDNVGKDIKRLDTMTGKSELRAQGYFRAGQKYSTSGEHSRAIACFSKAIVDTPYNLAAKQTNLEQSLLFRSYLARANEFLMIRRYYDAYHDSNLLMELMGSTKTTMKVYIESCIGIAETCINNVYSVDSNDTSAKSQHWKAKNERVANEYLSKAETENLLMLALKNDTLDYTQLISVKIDTLRKSITRTNETPAAVIV